MAIVAGSWAQNVPIVVVGEVAVAVAAVTVATSCAQGMRWQGLRQLSAHVERW